MFEDLEPRPQRGEPLRALSREDLDVYAVEDLQERIAALEAEITRSRAAIETRMVGQTLKAVGDADLVLFMVDARDPKRLFAGASPIDIYRSDDGGANWRRRHSLPPTASAPRVLPW